MGNVLLVYPELFRNFVLRRGGMHLLMSFAVSIEALVANSGIQLVLKLVYDGVPWIAMGKQFLQNVRAIRMVIE